MPFPSIFGAIKQEVVDCLYLVIFALKAARGGTFLDLMQVSVEQDVACTKLDIYCCVLLLEMTC